MPLQYCDMCGLSTTKPLCFNEHVGDDMCTFCNNAVNRMYKNHIAKGGDEETWRDNMPMPESVVAVSIWLRTHRLALVKKYLEA